MFDHNDITVQDIKRAQWWQAKKPLFRKIITSLLIVINVIIWGVFIYQLVLWIIYTPNHRETLRGLTQNYVNYEEFKERHKPISPLIGETQTIFLGVNSDKPQNFQYSLVAEAENPNKQWVIATLLGEFTLIDKKIPVQLVIFPYEKKYFLALNQTMSQANINGSLEIKSIHWRRIRPEMRSRVDILKNLIIRDVDFVASQTSEGETLLPAQVRFNVINQSAYSFWQVNSQIVIYQGIRPVAAYIFPIKNWLAGQERSIDINLNERLDYVTQVKVVLDVDVLDDNNIIKP